jgi:hypothetical protein
MYVYAYIYICISEAMTSEYHSDSYSDIDNSIYQGIVPHTLESLIVPVISKNILRNKRKLYI